MTEKSILLETGQLAKITLNSPKKLNALSEEMCIPLGSKLADWRKDKNVKAVLITGAGDKAFCAGGDIVDVVRVGKAEPLKALEFFRAEYRTNWRIKNFPKPYISFLDGIVMGGGVGLSVHGHYRVATERSMFAMPETTIGFYPDVGGTYFLPRLDGNMGMFLGLTGFRIYAADMLNLGIATHYIHSSKLDELEIALKKLDYGEDGFEEVEALLAKHCSQPNDDSLLADNEAKINRLFEGNKLSEVMANIAADDSEFAQKIAKTLSRMSPIAMAVTFEQIKRGSHLDFDMCMQLEMRLSSQMMHGSDFFEGVRALLVDKDKSPKWQPDKLEEISKPMIQCYFAEIDNELVLDWDMPV